MVEKKFHLESEKEIQRIGFRAQIVSFLMQEGIKSGNVFNEGNKRRVLVAIRYDANPSNADIEVKEINRIKNELVGYLNSLSETDNECYGQFPKDINATDLFDLSNPHVVNIVDLQTLSSALMLEQTSKGVGAMLSLKAALKPLEYLREV